MKAQYKGGFFLLDGLQTSVSTKGFACKCCGVIDVEESLVRAIIKLETELGKKIYVTNSTRCVKHNAEVGGSKNSTHLPATTAIDFYCNDVPVEDVFMTAVEIFNGVGVYWDGQHTFYHVDLRPNKLYWRHIKSYKYDTTENTLDEYKSEIDKIKNERR